MVKPHGKELEALLSACLNLNYDSTNPKLCDLGGRQLLSLCLKFLLSKMRAIIVPPIQDAMRMN